MRVAAIQSLFCLCAILCAQTAHADPDYRFKFSGVGGGNKWINVIGEHDLELGVSVTVKPAKNSIGLIRSNPESVKPGNWFGYTVEFTAENPSAGLVFSYVDEKNFCRFVVRGKEAVLTETKDGAEAVLLKAPLSKATGPHWALRLEFREGYPVSLSVNGEDVLDEMSDSAQKTTQRLTRRDKAGIGLISEAGPCKFTKVEAHGIAKF